MAEEPGTEQPNDDSAQGTAPNPPVPESDHNSGGNAWPVAQSDDDRDTDSGGEGDQPLPAEADGSAAPDRGEQESGSPDDAGQIRRTDADRWAASFANIGEQSNPARRADPPGRLDMGTVGNGSADDASRGSDRPSWADQVPVPPAGPAWRTDSPSRPWTDSPSSFSWGPDAGAPSAAVHPAAAPLESASYDRPAPGPASVDASGDGTSSAEDPVYDHSSSSRASLERTAQALPSNPPPPTGYPNLPTDRDRQPRGDQFHGNDPYGEQPYGNSQYGGPHGTDQYGNEQYGNEQYGAPPPGRQQAYSYGDPNQGGPPERDHYTGRQAGGPAVPAQRSEPQPGSGSTWSAPTAAAPPPAQPPQQWQQQPAAQQGWQPASQQAPPPQRHASAADLTSGSLVKPAAAVPRVGWRKMVHSVTGGTVNPGLSQAELTRRNLIERATAPVRGCHRIAVVSLKGGIGKTTTTAGLGLTLAEHRGDRVVALDANPDAGTLAERLTGQVDVTVRDLLDNFDSIRSFTDVSAFTSLAARLQVLASEQDPEMSEAFSEEEYRTVSDVLARYFNIFITDSGTGLLHSAMSGTLALADSVVVVGSPSVDGASRASKTLDWLIAHGHGELVSRSVAVISTVRPATKELDMARLRDHFTARVRAVVEIPYDRHLVTGGIIDINQLERPTEQAFLELAAIVADGFRFPPLIRPDREPKSNSGS